VEKRPLNGFRLVVVVVAVAAAAAAVLCCVSKFRFRWTAEAYCSMSGLDLLNSLDIVSAAERQSLAERVCSLHHSATVIGEECLACCL